VLDDILKALKDKQEEAATAEAAFEARKTSLRKAFKVFNAMTTASPNPMSWDEAAHLVGGEGEGWDEESLIHELACLSEEEEEEALDALSLAITEGMAAMTPTGTGAPSASTLHKTSAVAELLKKTRAIYKIVTATDPQALSLLQASHTFKSLNFTADPAAALASGRSLSAHFETIMKPFTTKHASGLPESIQPSMALMDSRVLVLQEGSPARLDMTAAVTTMLTSYCAVTGLENTLLATLAQEFLALIAKVDPSVTPFMSRTQFDALLASSTNPFTDPRHAMLLPGNYGQAEATLTAVRQTVLQRDQEAATDAGTASNGLPGAMGMVATEGFGFLINTISASAFALYGSARISIPRVASDGRPLPSAVTNSHFGHLWLQLLGLLSTGTLVLRISDHMAQNLANGSFLSAPPPTAFNPFAPQPSSSPAPAGEARLAGSKRKATEGSAEAAPAMDATDARPKAGNAKVTKALTLTEKRAASKAKQEARKNAPPPRRPNNLWAAACPRAISNRPWNESLDGCSICASRAHTQTNCPDPAAPPPSRVAYLLQGTTQPRALELHGAYAAKRARAASGRAPTTATAVAAPAGE
jgi:hypothetical protein